MMISFLCMNGYVLLFSNACLFIKMANFLFTASIKLNSKQKEISKVYYCTKNLDTVIKKISEFTYLPKYCTVN